MKKYVKAKIDEGNAHTAGTCIETERQLANSLNCALLSVRRHDIDSQAFTQENVNKKIQ